MTVSQVVAIAKQVQDTGCPLDKPANPLRMKVHAKRCAGVAFVLEHLSQERLPELEADLPACVQSIMTRLKAKGIGPGCVELPQHMWHGLQVLAEPSFTT